MKLTDYGLASDAKTLSLMYQVSEKYANSPIIKNLARRLRNEKNIFDYVVKIPYRAENVNQTVVSPIRTIEFGYANCVNYCVLIGSLLGALGIDYKFILVSYDGKPRAEHVYLQTRDNVIDCVYSQLYRQPINSKKSGETVVINGPINNIWDDIRGGARNVTENVSNIAANIDPFNPSGAVSNLAAKIDPSRAVSNVAAQFDPWNPKSKLGQFAAKFDISDPNSWVGGGLKNIWDRGEDVIKRTEDYVFNTYKKATEAIIEDPCKLMLVLGMPCVPSGSKNKKKETIDEEEDESSNKKLDDTTKYLLMGGAVLALVMLSQKNDKK